MLFSNLRYTQESVRHTFHDKKKIESSNKHIHQPIRVVEYSGVFWILNNRTAYSKQYNGHNRTKVIVEPFNQVKDEFWKKKTGDGSMPKVKY